MGVVNASMEFDLETLSPTYHLNLGLPGRSNALLIAEMLGLDKEIIEDARSDLDPMDLRAEDLLDEIHRQRDLARLAYEAAAEARQEAERLRRTLEVRLEKLEDERLEVLEKAREQAGVELENLQVEMDDVRRSLGRARQPLEPLKLIKEQVETLEEVIQKPVRRRNVQEIPQRPLKVGGKVHLRSLNMDGVISTLGLEDAEVQVGALRVRVRLEDLKNPTLEEVKPPVEMKRKADVPTDKVTLTARPSTGMELDLRGQRAEDALIELERYLENAYIDGMPFVRIIHGKGTGRLREVVRQALRHASHVSSWQTGQDGEGGDGVTVAKIKEE